MTDYLLTFACGATVKVKHPPTPEAVGLTATRKGQLRNGRLRVLVQRIGSADQPPLNRPDRPRDCRQCPHPRKAGRKRYECFPADYAEQSQPGGKYHGKRFREFCEEIIACFPDRVTELEDQSNVRERDTNRNHR